MNFTIETAKLQELVASVIKAVPNTNLNPGLKGMLFSFANGKLSLTCMNESVTLRNAAPATGDDCSFILLADRIDAVVKAIDGETVTMDDNDKFVTLSCGKSLFRLLKYGEVKNFPSFPLVDTEVFHISGNVFRDAIGYTAFAVGKGDGVQQVFTGINLAFENKMFKVAGTNGHRVAVYRKEIGGEGTFATTLPGIALQDFAKMLNEDEVTVQVSGNRAHIKQGDFETVMVAIGGIYPPYERIIPPDTAIKVKADRKNLLGALTRIALCSEGEVGSVRVTVNASNVVLSAKGDTGSGEEPVDAEVTKESTEPFVITFNSKYILKALKAAKEANVVLGFNQVLSPAVIRFEGLDEYIYVISPLRTHS